VSGVSGDCGVCGVCDWLLLCRRCCGVIVDVDNLCDAA